MKKQKMVSLDDETAAIAANMKNFSQWVRIGLRAHAQNMDVATETALRVRFAKACYTLASRIVELEHMHNPEGFTGDIYQIVSEATNQTTLEEY